MARWTWKVVLGAGAVAMVVYFLLPGANAKDGAYCVIGLASVGGVLAGVALNRPADRAAWVALAAGNFAFVVGDGAFAVLPSLLHRPLPFPSAADAFYLAGYPFLAFGIARLARGTRSARSARESSVDAAVVALGALAVSWHFLMGSYAADPSLGALGKLVNLAYPVLDLGVLFFVVQGLVLGTARRPFHRLLATAMVVTVVADFAYDVMVLHDTYATGNPVDAGWLASYVLVAAAALHPSAGAPAIARTPVRVPARSRRNLPLVAVAGLVAPGILLAGAVEGVHGDTGPLALISCAIFLLVLVRMWWLVDRIGAQAATLEASLAARASLEEELRHQAFHDALTGLPNRALLQERVERALAGGARAEGAVAICFCDLDGFKTVNDSLGHLVGDAVLQAVAKRLAHAVRPGDTVARLGGDEFAVLMEAVDDPEVPAGVAERIVAVLRQPVEVDGREIALSVSVGFAAGEAGTSAEELLSRADSAMYDAKANGRNRVAQFEDAMRDRSLERLELVNAFPGALEREEFVLEFQPQYGLGDDRLEGFEALLRWEHPHLGRLVPERFIALAEETGHIVAIGRWVMEAACLQAAQWSEQFASPVVVSVNLSRRQLADPNLVDDVRTVLSVSGLPAAQLVLEVAEGGITADRDRALATLQHLKALGVLLAIDDFGTGYSSLTYLRQFPIDRLKIDEAFVGPLADPRGEGGAFVTTIVALAHSLGLSTVAEGIEEDGQREQLRELGCDSAQGFLLGRPLSPEAATSLLRAAGPPAVRPLPRPTGTPRA